MIILGRKVGEVVVMDNAGLCVLDIDNGSVTLAVWDTANKQGLKVTSLDASNTLRTINSQVRIELTGVSENNVNIGFEAPGDYLILRGELATAEQLAHVPPCYRSDLE